MTADALTSSVHGTSVAMVSVLADVNRERVAQDGKWGEQNHRDGTGGAQDQTVAALARQTCDDAFAAGVGSWALILTEEYAEALAESDPAKLRAELIQVAAVAVAWVEAIDRREATS